MRTTQRLLSLKSSSGEYTLLLLRDLCYLAPLKHYAQAIQLSEKVYKVLEQLPSEFFPNNTRLPLRRLWSKFKDAI